MLCPFMKTALSAEPWCGSAHIAVFQTIGRIFRERPILLFVYKLSLYKNGNLLYCF